MGTSRTPTSFNPRTPCGVRLDLDTLKRLIPAVSIHALLAECDSVFVGRSKSTTSFNPRTPCGVRPRKPTVLKTFFRFQSTHSLRSATVEIRVAGWFPTVSIHALLAECDSNNTVLAEAPTGFNPRTPCGVRLPLPGILGHIHRRFQSTHSLRSATEGPCIPPYWQKVSIHALLAECDRLLRAYCTQIGKFQSTHSLRSATTMNADKTYNVRVSIHALLAECDHHCRVRNP